MKNRIVSLLKAPEESRAGMGRRAQALLELMLAMMVIMFLLYGLVKASQWATIDSLDRRFRHDARLRTKSDATIQLRPSYRFRSADLEYRSDKKTKW